MNWKQIIIKLIGHECPTYPTELVEQLRNDKNACELALIKEKEDNIKTPLVVNGTKSDSYQYRARNLKYRDPRMFFTTDNTLPIMKGDSFDDIALECLNWVYKNIEYAEDRTDSGRLTEHWRFAFETLQIGMGDCDDHAILIANMMIMNGIPEERVYIAVGGTEMGYHAWCMYYNDSGKWQVIDSTLFPTTSLQGLLWNSRKAGHYHYIDFAFNRTNTFVHNVKFDRGGQS